MSEHTPGPWIYEGDGWVAVDDPDNKDASGHGVSICRVRGAQSSQIDANGALIAAAPETAAERDRLRKINGELVAALERIERRVNGNDGLPDDKTASFYLGYNAANDACKDIARAALDKARKAPVPKHKDCEVRFCNSGLPATRSATECIDDGAWNVSICQACFDAFKMHRDGDDLPGPKEAKDLLAKAREAQP